MNGRLPPLWPFLLGLVLLVLLAMIGCAAKPPQEAAPPPPKVQVPCPDPTPLFVPQMANSPQLEEALFTAYRDLLAQYLACQQQVSP